MSKRIPGPGPEGHCEQDDGEPHGQQDRGEIGDVRAEPNVPTVPSRQASPATNPERDCPHGGAAKDANQTNEQMTRWTRWMAVATFALAFIGVWQARLTREMISETSRQIDGSLRAWVLVDALSSEKIVEGETLKASVSLHNFGNSPATDLQLSYRSDLFRMRKPPANFCEFPQGGDLRNVPFGTLAQGRRIDYTVTQQADPTITKHRHDPGASVMLYGCVRYNDAVGTNRWTSFCARLLDDGSAPFCENGNLTDASRQPE